MRHFVLPIALFLASCGGGGASPCPPTPADPTPPTLAASPSGAGSFYTGMCEVRVVSWYDSPVVGYEPVGPVAAGHHLARVTFADGSVVSGWLLFAAPVVTIYVIP